MLNIVSNKQKDKYKTIELDGLPPSFFVSNRKNFFSTLSQKLENYEKDSILVLQGGKDIQRFDTDVVHFHFLQDANFYYLTGVRETDFYCVLDLKDENITLFWVVPPESTKIWSYVPTLEQLTKQYGIETKDMAEFYKFIGIRNPSKIYVLNGTNSDSKRRVKTAELNFPPEYEYLAKLVDPTEFIYEILADSRTRKTAEEIEFISFVNDVTAEAHLSILKNMKSRIKNERDIEAVFFDYISTNYYTRFTSYQLICGSGRNSSILHYNNNDSDVQKDNLNLNDLGAKIGGYCADVTSTIPKLGKYNFLQKEIYNIVLKANRTCIEKMRPGVSWTDVHLLAESIILEGLRDLGIIRDGYTTKEMLVNRVATYFFPHGLGHFIGLDVHDVGGYLSWTPKRSDLPGLKYLRTARILEENNILTVEPGIYFIENLLERAFKNASLEKYFNIPMCRSLYGFGGVRIEDSVLVTKDGSRNLTEKLPRAIEEIEKIMNS